MRLSCKIYCLMLERFKVSVNFEFIHIHEVKKSQENIIIEKSKDQKTLKKCLSREAQADPFKMRTWTLDIVIIWLVIFGLIFYFNWCTVQYFKTQNVTALFILEYKDTGTVIFWGMVSPAKKIQDVWQILFKHRGGIGMWAQIIQSYKFCVTCLSRFQGRRDSCPHSSTQILHILYTVQYLMLTYKCSKLECFHRPGKNIFRYFGSFFTLGLYLFLACVLLGFIEEKFAFELCRVIFDPKYVFADCFTL